MEMRKGILFSFILISMTVTLLTLLTVHRTMISFFGEKLAVETRVNSMTNFYESIIVDGGKAIDIISKRAVSSATNHVITEGKGLEKADSTLIELILNGTLNKTAESLMEDTTFPDWINKIKELGALSGFNTSISIQNLEVKPYDSWNLLVSIEIYVNISDQQGIANLKRNANITQIVSIEDFEDPLYPLNTQGRGTNIVTKSPYQNNFTQNIENLKVHVEKLYYHPSLNGASFLDRLEGKLEVQEKYQSQTNNIIGLESFVNKDYLASLFIPVNIEKTNIDYLYFSTSSYPSFKVKGMDEKFRMDNELSIGNKTHSVIYGVSEILV